MEKSAKGLPPLERSKLSKKSQDKGGEILKNCMELLSGGIIVDSNYIGTIFNRLIQKLLSKDINYFEFLQKRFS